MSQHLMRVSFVVAALLATQWASSQTANASLIGPSEVGFTQVYGLDIPNGPVAFNSSAIPYSVDNSGSVTTGSFSRIAYHMELQRAGGPLEYVWVSMDAFTNDAGLIGVPSLGPNGTGGVVFQQTVANMNVFSNQAGIVTGTGNRNRQHRVLVGRLPHWKRCRCTGRQWRPLRLRRPAVWQCRLRIDAGAQLWCEPNALWLQPMG